MSDQPDVRRLVLRTLMPGFAGTVVPVWLDAALRDGLGSVCLYGSNVVDVEQLTGLCADLRSRSPQVVLATDEEGGDVTRLHYRTGSPYVGNGVLGRLDDLDATRAQAAWIARDLRGVGIQLDLGPVVDVNSSDDNPVIGSRSFGADPDLVARHSAAWVEALQAGGVAACAKHFPGHGDTTADSHHALPVVDVDADLLRRRELAPFAAVVQAGAASVMTAAIMVPSVDAVNAGTFSAALLQGVLRDELGFDGVIVTDALDMAGASAETGIPEAAVRALVAGCDLLCLGSDTDPALFAEIVEHVVAALASGRLPLARVAEAAARVERLAIGVAGSPEARPSDVGLDATPAFALTDRARTWLEGDGDVAIVQVSSPSNLAVGQVPWGPAALGVAVAEDAAAGATRVAVVGRDLASDHPAWACADRLRSAGADVLVVESGWPRSGARADVVTWGGSPAVARHLVALLTGARS
ncbi:glycoside hydrolase family 3 protein [Longivirga aurantiaca]|uniref:Glycoside hydrolase family 3 protein n=1 Tax=Longivirga aurantiaca TaxID=1837743 RepID=A0ABW1SZ35_9ACTN